MNLTQASRQWASRPEDERFTSLTQLLEHCLLAKRNSAAKVLSTRALEVQPLIGNERGLAVVGPNGTPVVPTHWAFSQLAQRAGAPAGYLRDLPSPIVADCLNWGLRSREVDEIGVLLRRVEVDVESQPQQQVQIHAVTGPNYGRIWNADIVQALTERFGDGVTGHFRVPGEFGKALTEVTKANTTLYASDRDFFVFLADEDRRIETPNRRNGQPGSLARGFFCWNSEVGAQTVGIAGFLFDYVCCNRIVWGAEGYKEVRIRHTSGAPWRWIEEAAPAIERYAESETKTLEATLKEARQHRLGDGDAVSDFLSKRFSKSEAKGIEAAHLSDEGRPIESLWDAVTGVTAYARSIPYQDERVKLEREGGKLLDLVRVKVAN